MEFHLSVKVGLDPSQGKFQGGEYLCMALFVEFEALSQSQWSSSGL